MGEMLEIYACRGRFVTTKQGILDRLSCALGACKAILGSNTDRIDINKIDGFDECNIHLISKRQVQIFAQMLDELVRKVMASNLFDAPEEHWHYVLMTDGFAIEIRLRSDFHHVDTGSDKSWQECGSAHDCTVIENLDEYTMFRVTSHMLSIDAYSKMYDVQADRIRQWIKCGKLAGAVKYGNEWRIPEIAGEPEP